MTYDQKYLNLSCLVQAETVQPGYQKILLVSSHRNIYNLKNTAEWKKINQVRVKIAIK